MRMLSLIDEHNREFLTVWPERRWSSAKVMETPADVMVVKGVPEHLRPDNGPGLVAHFIPEEGRVELVRLIEAFVVNISSP